MSFWGLVWICKAYETWKLGNLVTTTVRKYWVALRQWSAKRNKDWPHGSLEILRFARHYILKTKKKSSLFAKKSRKLSQDYLFSYEIFQRLLYLGISTCTVHLNTVECYLWNIKTLIKEAVSEISLKSASQASQLNKFSFTRVVKLI